MRLQAVFERNTGVKENMAKNNDKNDRAEHATNSENVSQEKQVPPGSRQETPLQQSKRDTLAQMKNEDTNPDAEQAPRKRGRPKGSTNKAKSGPTQTAAAAQEIEQPFDPKKAEAEIEVIMGLLDGLRKGLGIKRPPNEMAVMAIKASYPDLAERYGTSATKYLPELMMFGGLIMYGIDTARAVRELKMEIEREEIARKQAEPKEEKAVPKNMGAKAPEWTPY